MIKTSFAFIKTEFSKAFAYRAESITGIINAVVMIFVNIYIWKAIYEAEEQISGIQLQMIITYIILSFAIQTIFTMEEYVIQQKVRTGLITSDLLKPINFNLYLFSTNLGNILFKFVFQLIPVILISVIFFKMLPPFNSTMGLLFILSLILGFLILYNLNYIIWISAFWFNKIFSLVTIKNSFVLLFSGALIPLWFLPKQLLDVIELTPFKSIYFVPIAIYLGQIPEDEIMISFIKQIVWMAILFLAGQILWHKAKKQLVVQGG